MPSIAVVITGSLTEKDGKRMHTSVTVRDRTLNVNINGIDTKVRFRVSYEATPTGLARIDWTRNFEYVSIKIFGITHKHAATIIWTVSYASDKTPVARYGWSISSEPELWGHVNTLGYKGKRYTYATADDCMMGLIKYVVRALTSGNKEWK